MQSVRTKLIGTYRKFRKKTIYSVLTTCTLKVARLCQEAVLIANRILGMVRTVERS